MITESSSLAKGEVVTAGGASTAAGVKDSPEIAIDPNDKHLGTDHLLSDLKGRTISGAFITIVAQGAQFLLSLVSIMVLA